MKFFESCVMMILKGYLFSTLYALLCLGLAFGLYKLGVEKKITRKIVHILVGFEWVILYHFVGPSWHFLVVCLLFLLILAVAHRKNLMPMISSDGDNAPGTVYYAVAMSIMAIITLFVPKMILPFGIGVFCTSFGDGLAGLVGQSITASWNKKVYGNKSIAGAAVNFVTCFGVAYFFSNYFGLGIGVSQCFAIAFLALELELFTGLGLDNITITVATSLLAFAFINFEQTGDYLVPVLLTPAIIMFASKKRALTLSGIIAALFVDVAISVSLGNFGFCILLAFFVGGIAVDKFKKTRKKTRQSEKAELEKRGDCRDHVQVLANSLVAVVCALSYLITSEALFVVAFTASLAEAFADTVASGIGVISGKAFDIFRMKPCQPGISGGMSVLGTLSSLAAAILISFFAFCFGRITFTEALIVFIAAFLGAIFDSFLGSIVQVKYRCVKCGLILEKEEHCAEKTEKYSGFEIINNDVVNLLGTLFAAIASIFVCLII